MRLRLGDRSHITNLFRKIFLIFMLCGWVLCGWPFFAGSPAAAKPGSSASALNPVWAHSITRLNGEG